MRPWALGAVLLATILIASSDAKAGNRNGPRRYARGSYAEYIVRNRNGQQSVRQVYNGYTNRFPPPAFLYYGYPHGKDAMGFGFNDALSPGF